jgi:hypothetical protein
MDEKDLQKYYEKSGDSFIYPDNLVVNDHGFMTWTVDPEGTFLGLNVYGDGAYWDEFSQTLAKHLGCKRIRFSTRRNPKVWEKKFGYKQVGYIMEKEV